MKSACLLKKRLQIFTSDQMPKIKKLMYRQLQAEYQNYTLPQKNSLIPNAISSHNIPQADQVVLFSCSQRANKGRKRFRKSGQTASIYMSDKLGGAQKGTLVNTFSWKQGPVLFDSVPNLQAITVGPILRKYLPKDTPLFTDEGYKWWSDKNHRMINHNAKAKSKRYKWARNRWSKNGVHCQVAEGNNALLKKSFAAYGWIKPEYSQMYLDEFSFFKGVKYYGWEALVEEDKKEINYRPQDRGKDGIDHRGSLSVRSSQGKHQRPSKAGESTVGIVSGKYAQHICLPNQWLKNKIQKLCYKPLTFEERQKLEINLYRYKPDSKLLPILEKSENQKLRQQINIYKQYHEGALKLKDWQKAKEKQYQYLAVKLWEALPDDGWGELNDIAERENLSKLQLLRIVRTWAIFGIAEVVDRTYIDGINKQLIYDIQKILPVLPDILYRQNRKRFENNSEWKNYVKTDYFSKPKKSRFKYD